MQLSTTLRALPLLFIAPAFAQDFNIDVGQNLVLWPLPSSTYGAGIARPGLWTSFNPSGPMPAALTDIAGNATGVLVSSTASGTVNNFPIALVGDDSALMEDFFFGGGAGTPTATFTFSNLLPGEYRVTTYGVDPVTSGDDTQVTVIGSIDPPQTLVSPWLGGHGLGVSFTQHNVSSTGTLTIELEQVGTILDPRIICNGIQLEYFPPLGQQITVLCDPANNHFQGDYAKMSGSFGSGVGSDLHIEVADGPTGEFGFMLVSPDGSASLSLFSGVLCLGAPQGRYNPTIASNQGLPQLNSIGQFDAMGLLQNIVGTATSSGGSGFDVPSELPFSPPGQLIMGGGSTWYFQCWFRDQIAMPGDSANFSNMLQVVFL